MCSFPRFGAVGEQDADCILDLYDRRSSVRGPLGGPRRTRLIQYRMGLKGRIIEGTFVGAPAGRESRSIRSRLLRRSFRRGKSPVVDLFQEFFVAREDVGRSERANDVVC